MDGRKIKSWRPSSRMGHTIHARRGDTGKTLCGQPWRGDAYFFPEAVQYVPCEKCAGSLMALNGDRPAEKLASPEAASQLPLPEGIDARIAHIEDLISRMSAGVRRDLAEMRGGLNDMAQAFQQFAEVNNKLHQSCKAALHRGSLNDERIASMEGAIKTERIENGQDDNRAS